MRHEEHDEQVALMQWWRLFSQCRGIEEEHLFAIPNGGDRHPATAARLKAEGVRAGIPDLFLSLPAGKANGAFIEMKKRKGGVVSKQQAEAMQRLHRAGYCCVVCEGWKEAADFIRGYVILYQEGDRHVRNHKKGNRTSIQRTPRMYHERRARLLRKSKRHPKTKTERIDPRSGGGKQVFEQ